MPNIGGPELLIILFIFILIFGAGALPKLAKAVSEARRELRHTDKEDHAESLAQSDTDDS